jgi:hypothetical protein
LIYYGKVERELPVAPDCVYNAEVRTRICGWYRRSVIPIAAMGYALLVVTQSTPIENRWAIVATFVTFLFAFGDIARRQTNKRVATFGEELRNRIGAKYARDLSEAVHVGYTPTKEPRSYGGDNSWDVGYLSFDGCLEYYGDQQHWRLLPSEIIQAKVCGYIRPRLLLQFQPALGLPLWICLEPRIAGSSTEQYAHMQQIRIRIAMMGDSSRLPSPAVYGNADPELQALAAQS